MPQYRNLRTGEEIQEGDEFRRPNGEWNNISKVDIDSYKKSVGKPPILRKKALPVRRPLKGGE